MWSVFFFLDLHVVHFVDLVDKINHGKIILIRCWSIWFYGTFISKKKVDRFTKSEFIYFMILNHIYHFFLRYSINLIFNMVELLNKFYNPVIEVGPGMEQNKLRLGWFNCVFFSLSDRSGSSSKPINQALKFSGL